MKYILDTDTLIYFLKGNKNIALKIGNISPDEISTTMINQAELLFGAYNSIKKKQNLITIENFLKKIHVIPFCHESTHLYAKQKALLKKSGTLIADLDLMIASIALNHNSTLVTNNLKHFRRIEKLKIENWTIE